jgi:hypothetical protein
VKYVDLKKTSFRQNATASSVFSRRALTKRVQNFGSSINCSVTALGAIAQPRRKSAAMRIRGFTQSGLKRFNHNRRAQGVELNRRSSWDNGTERTHKKVTFYSAGDR